MRRQNNGDGGLDKPIIRLEGDLSSSTLTYHVPAAMNERYRRTTHHPVKSSISLPVQLDPRRRGLMPQQL
jgi:hypothetical protein